jgi:cysteine desulfurase
MKEPTLLYADHHATTPLAPEVFEAMLPWFRNLAANPSSVHRPGQAARKAVEAARAEVARALGAAPSEIVLTSGGTESNALAIRGGASAARERDPIRRTAGFTAAEHPAVREAMLALRRERFEVREIAVDGRGVPDTGMDGILEADTALVSAILANNETGAIFDRLPEVALSARRQGVLVHTDAVQAVGKIPVDVRSLGVDLLSLTAHKFGGPKGAGALYVRDGIPILPLQPGGGQEAGRRGGTENVPAIVGLGKAIGLAVQRLEEEGVRLSALREQFEEGLRQRIPGVRFPAGEGPRLPTVSSVILPGIDAESLLIALDLEGIAASAGSACHSGTTMPSRVLLAMGLSPADARSTLRFSFGRTTTRQEVDCLLERLPVHVSRRRKRTSGPEVLEEKSRESSNSDGMKRGEGY